MGKNKSDAKRARQEATITEHEVTDTETNNYPGNFAELNAEFGDDVWDLNKFIEKFRVVIVREDLDEKLLEFDMIGIDPAIANAFRRILISEVPTVAIEKVEIYNNTSLFQDDFLSHRLGLIPIKVDPRRFNFPISEEQRAKRDADKEDSIAFELKLKCSKGKDDTVVNRDVQSKHLIFAPADDAQAGRFDGAVPTAVMDNILIAKLSPGQELDLRLVCVKGIGRDHAKFSPVCTASYRLLPKIELLREVSGADAELLRDSFSQGVIEVNKKGSKKQAKVANARLDMSSRNIYRHEHLKDAVRMSLVKDHFIYTIESTGALTPHELMVESIDIMIEKCESFIAEISELKTLT